MTTRIRIAVIGLFLALTFAATTPGGQTPSSTDDVAVLQGSEFSNARTMLSDHLKRIALDLLRERERRVAELTTPQQIIARQTYIRERIRRAVGDFPERTPLNPRVTGVLKRSGYRVEKVVFESQPGMLVTANLYVPESGTPPYPGILMPLGHERGSKAHEAWQRLLITVARNGFVALAYDPIGQGERIQHYDSDFKESKVGRSTTEHTMIGIQCLLTGQNLARYTIWDGMRALDYLLSRPEVDRERIACTGNSGGGTHTAYLSALDDRIKVAAPSCYITSWRSLLETIGPQDAEQNMPPFLHDGLDQADFIQAFAPRPYLILAAIRDFFPIAGTRATHKELTGIYARLGASEKLGIFEANDEHGYTRPRRLAAYRWLNRWLKGTDSPLEEPELELENETTLDCTPTGQLATSFGSETVFSLNLKRAEALRLERVRTRRTESASTIQSENRARIERITAFERGSSPIQARSLGTVQRDGYRIEKLAYSSEPGITIPALMFLPDKAGRSPAVLYVDDRGKRVHALPSGEIEDLVRAGTAVLAVDLRGMGETSPRRETSSEPYFGQFDAAMTALLAGKTLLGLRIRDIVGGLDVLAGRPEVDAARISGYARGVAAPVLLHAAVLDARLARIVLEDMVASYQTIVEQRIHRNVFENVVPGVLAAYDLPEIIAGLAPRPVTLIGVADPLGFALTSEQANLVYRPAQAAYETMSASASLQLKTRRPGQRLLQVWPKTDTGSAR